MLMKGTSHHLATQQLLFLQSRNFAYASKYVGVNNYIRQERHKLRKYGMKRLFYDKIPLVQRLSPEDQYRSNLTKEDLEPYSDEVKQAFSLNNASDTEITKAKFQQVREM